MIFTRITLAKRPASRLALAVALVSGTVLGATALATPAMAAKQDKDDKKENAKSGDYSDEFRAVYAPLAEMAAAGTADVATLQAKLPELTAATVTEDEKFATGSVIFQIAQKASDHALQLQGLELILASGKAPAESVGLYNFLAGQLAYNLKDYSKSRGYVQRAIDAGYTDNDAQAFIAETYFTEGNHAEGLKQLTAAIEARHAAGQPVSEQWIKRGLSVAYNNELPAEANRYALMFVKHHPNADNWSNAVAITLNSTRFEVPAVLDLLRLARRTEALIDANLYREYVDAADYRRLPGEVVAVIDEGFASGKLPQSDQNIVDVRKEAQSRVAGDKAELGNLISAARSGSAQLGSVVSAADLALSYGQTADAAELYTKALGMPGVDSATVQTRLGIALVDQGKYAEAQASFDKVQGPRKAIANLWSAFAAQKAGGGTATL